MAASEPQADVEPALSLEAEQLGDEDHTPDSETSSSVHDDADEEPHLPTPRETEPKAEPTFIRREGENSCFERIFRPYRPKVKVKTIDTCSGLLFVSFQKSASMRGSLGVYGLDTPFFAKIKPLPTSFLDPIESLFVQQTGSRVFIADRSFSVRYLDAGALATLLQEKLQKTDDKKPKKTKKDSKVTMRPKVELPYLKMESGAINASLIAPLGNHVIVASPKNPETFIFSMADNTYLRAFRGARKHPTALTTFKVELDGQRTGFVLIGGRDRRVYLFDFAHQKLLLTFRGHQHSVFFVGFDSDRLVSVSKESLRIWEIRGRKIATILPPDQTEFTSIRLFKERIFCGLSTGDIRVLDLLGQVVAIIRCDETPEAATPRQKVDKQKNLRVKLKARVCRMAIDPQKELLFVVLGWRTAIYVWDISKAETWTHGPECPYFLAPKTESVAASSEKCLVQ